jgi:hypothetical protein
MRKLLFFSRVALICNICFLITLILLYMPLPSESGLSSTIIIMGRVLSVVITAVLMLIYIIVLLTARNLFSHVPAWLVITNFLFFVGQIILLVK